MFLFLYLETSAGKRKTSEDKSSSNMFEDLELFTVMALGVLGKTHAEGNIFKHKVEQGNPDIKKIWRMASLESS